MQVMAQAEAATSSGAGTRAACYTGPRQDGLFNPCKNILIKQVSCKFPAGS
jgi:hypothetical protein